LRRRRRPRAFHDQVELVLPEEALGMGPRHLVVYLGDDRAADVERGHQVVGSEPKAVFAAGVGRAHLEHQDIATDLLLTNEGRQLRIGHRQDLQRTGIDEGAVGADAAVRSQPQVVGMLRPHDARIA
jgi:hypothetical protein